ncbi:MAG TPA: hypothetical protein VNO43_06765 [Candidatus Eisenbacteria bacterium]|nr:hypothetical protein [Candidatus Eisenbacteria bacterium]
MNAQVAIRYDPSLIEEAVFLAAQERAEGHVFRRERERIYGVLDPELREQLFQELNRSWFSEWRLDRGVKDAVAEQPSIPSNVNACWVVRAARGKDEGAELFVARQSRQPCETRRTLRLMLRPQSLLAPESLRFFLRCELFHIADILDPAFGYEPLLPESDRGPLYARVIVDRYRVLWNATIWGRMARLGWATEPPAAELRGEFLRAFSMLEDREAWFARFIALERPTHSALAAFACDPRAAAGRQSESSLFAAPCPLCRFPTHAFEPQPEALETEIKAAIARDFPAWKPAAGLCRQCADLYRANRLSSDAAKQLPGCNARAG